MGLSSYIAVSKTIPIPPYPPVPPPRRFVVLDVETWLYEREDGTIAAPFRLAVAIYYELGEDGEVRRLSQIIAHSAGELWAWVVGWAKAKETLLVYAHNAQFDLLASDALRNLDRLGWQIWSLGTPAGRLLLSARQGNKTLMVVDTTMIYPLSLAQIGEHVGLAKLNMPEQSASDDTWATYCERDVEVLARAMGRWIRFVQAHDLGPFRFTAPGQALSAYLYRFAPRQIYRAQSREILALERASYYGGRTECLYLRPVRGERVGYFDVNSLYPFAMLSRPHPYRLYGEIERPNPREARAICEDYCPLMWCYVDTDEPAYPKRLNGKLVFPTGRFWTVLIGDEARYALRRRHVKSIRRLFLYHQDYLFHDFVSYFWGLRRQARQDGNRMEDLCAKLILNGLYGKWGQRGYFTRLEDVADPGEFYVATYMTEDGRREGVYYNLGHRGILVKETDGGKRSMVAIAASITASARQYLYRLMREAGWDNVYYVDTDALVLPVRVAERRLKDYIGDGLGQLKLEKETSYFQARGPKDYIWGGEEKVKGRGKVLGIVGEGAYLVERWLRLAGALRQGIIGMALMTRRIWRRRGEYDKGKVTLWGHVQPLVLNEPP